MTIDDLKGIFKSLPLEITYADNNDRVRFFTKSQLTGGFARLKTIIGKKLEYCHPPRLENYVKLNVKQLKESKQLFKEFWTRMGDRIIRVLIVGVRNNKGEYIGTLEVVEDFTEIIRNPEEIMKKIIIL
ncbi:MAG: PAS domain-containing protein [Staphylothermus sp.]|nr:PAS domain-containing protein [Staphylothermus sp.]